MRKEQTLTLIEQEWKALLDSFAGLTDNMLMESGAVNVKSDKIKGESA